MNSILNYYVKNGVRNALNIPKNITTRVMGEKHTIAHRMGIGMVIMIFGVTMANFHTSISLIDLGLEGIGYTLHAIGATPMIEHLAQLARREESNHG